GAGHTSFFGDTWAGDGNAWAQVATAPSPRYGHTMAYDLAHGRTVIFGGYNGSMYVGNTRGSNGSTWTQASTTGPSPRYEHAMAYDTARGRIALFGGFNGSYLGDVWEWDGTAWAQMAIGPSPRYGHAMAYDIARGRTVMFGGSNGSMYV